MNLYRNDGPQFDGIKIEFVVTGTELMRIDTQDFDWFKSWQATDEQLISDRLFCLVKLAEAVESLEQESEGVQT